MNTVKNIISVEEKKPKVLTIACFLLSQVAVFCLVFGSAVHNVFGSKKKNSKENLVIGSFKKKPRRKTQCEPFAILDRTLTCEKTVVL